jgi:hypothetical protein
MAMDIFQTSGFGDRECRRGFVVEFSRALHEAKQLAGLHGDVRTARFQFHSTREEVSIQKSRFVGRRRGRW